MAADLTGVRRKVARAKNKLNALREEVTCYMDSSPYRLVEETDGDEHVVRSYIDREPDDEWGLEIAEIAGQARSALDLLVRQLVIDSGNDPTGTRTQFPIFRNRDEYVRKRGKSGQIPSHRDTMLKGVASRHRRVIDDLQPYQRGRRVEEDPLAILDTVTNRDKHRDVHVALAGVAGARFKLLFSDYRVYAVWIDKSHGPFRIANNDVLLGLGAVQGGTPDQHVEMQVEEIEVDVFLEGDRIVSLADMERSVLHVAGIVERFAKRIKP